MQKKTPPGEAFIPVATTPRGAALTKPVKRKQYKKKGHCPRKGSRPHRKTGTRGAERNAGQQKTPRGRSRRHTMTLVSAAPPTPRKLARLPVLAAATTTTTKTRAGVRVQKCWRRVWIIVPRRHAHYTQKWHGAVAFCEGGADEKGTKQK